MTGRLLTTRQVADQLGVTVETVLRWARAGDLPSNRAIRFREGDLDQWLAQRATPGRGGADNHTGRRPLNAIVTAADNRSRGGA